MRAVDGRNLIFLCQGGLGDQLCSEPVIRKCVAAFPGSQLFVVSIAPSLFSHLGLPCFDYGGPVEVPGDKPSLVLESFSSERDFGLNCNLFHPVDFISISVLGKQLVGEERRMGTGSFGGPAVLGAEDVAVHPGKTWASRTFPSSWWTEVVDLISRERRVAVVGSRDGTVPVEVPRGCLDLRGYSLESFSAEMSSGCALLSNDSFPVHLAGCFDGPIFLIPTSKNPDLVLPWRTGCISRALFKKPMWEIMGGEFDKIPSGTDMLDYIPEPAEVALSVLQDLRRVRRSSQSNSPL